MRSKNVFATWRIILLITVCIYIVRVGAKMWNEKGLFRLEINEQCHDYGRSISLQFHDVTLPLLMYAFKDDSEFSESVACLQTINTANQSPTFNSSCWISDRKYKFRILNNLTVDNNEIATNPADVPQFYLYEVDCTDLIPKINVRKLVNPLLMTITLPKMFTIGNKQFNLTAKFRDDDYKWTERSTGQVGEFIDMDISLPSSNTFGIQSAIDSCELQINSDPPRKISILKNYSILDGYQLLHFWSRYSPHELIESTSANFKIKFDAFVLKSMMPYRLYCEACVECSSLPIEYDESFEHEDE